VQGKRAGLGLQSGKLVKTFCEILQHLLTQGRKTPEKKLSFARVGDNLAPALMETWRDKGSARRFFEGPGEVESSSPLSVRISSQTSTKELGKKGEATEVGGHTRERPGKLADHRGETIEGSGGY